MTLKAVDVTDQEVLSSLKRDLIDKESIVSSARFASLQAKLRTLFRRPSLQVGLAAVQGDRVLVLNDAMSHDHADMFADSAHHKTSEFKGSLYERAVIQNRPIIIDDLAAWPDRTPWEEELIAAGARTFVCAPLQYQDRAIGTLELISPKAGRPERHPPAEARGSAPALLHGRPAERRGAGCPRPGHDQREMHEHSPGGGVALPEGRVQRDRAEKRERLRRRRGDGADRVRERLPAVRPGRHPRRVRSAWGRHPGRPPHPAPPRRRRSAHRPTKCECSRRSPSSLTGSTRRIAQVQRSLNSGDEIGIVGFLRANVESLFDHLTTFGTAVRARIELYRGALDARLGVVYRRRQLFEESVSRVAEAISAYLDLEELAAQAIFPHYFEKQKTDGVDYQIYVGPSLLEDGRFDPICLKNLRLWQLMLTCGIAVRAHRLRDRLPVPLETTHLILVQHTPRSISFRFDEKRFDVDGAYDIRYEIVKKSIDKAVVEGTSDRVTQPGKIAIIYGQSAEGREYRGYIEYSTKPGLPDQRGGRAELGELQGVQGLRALRVRLRWRTRPSCTA
jgi:hypothetical protein